MNLRFCWSYREDFVLRLMLVILLPVKVSPRSQLLTRDAASPVCTASERARSRKFNAQDSGLTFFSVEVYSCKEGPVLRKFCTEFGEEHTNENADANCDSR
jgi:hypothetical protein